MNKKQGTTGLLSGHPDHLLAKTPSKATGPVAEVRGMLKEQMVEKRTRKRWPHGLSGCPKDLAKEDQKRRSQRGTPKGRGTKVRSVLELMTNNNGKNLDTGQGYEEQQQCPKI